MNLLIQILSTAIGILVAYFLISRLTGKNDKNFRNAFFKYLGILLAIAIIFQVIIHQINSKPEYLTQPVEQLKVNPDIKTRIGDFNGFKYNKHELQNIEILPAKFGLTMYGTKGEIELNIEVDSSSNIYEITDLQIMDLSTTK